ncbi:MAG: class I SAM-dependent rRNA methyltransferase [Deltaproteobacteria bacterium]|nr:class I SAM-dependent rRNA methyltransferase [Deltaproteobacteria bacterium]
MKKGIGNEHRADAMEILERAIERRRPHPSRVEAFRLLNGSGDDAPPGLAVDQYGNDLVLWIRPAMEDSVGPWIEALHRRVRPRAMIRKILRKPVTRSDSSVIAWAGTDRGDAERSARPTRRGGPDRPDRPDQPDRPEVAGALELPVEVREDGATFHCTLNEGLQTGLFLDQRDARRFVRDHADGRDVLNLFAYTCAFSVQAALGGARRVTSVDVSRKALRRGRANMEASGVCADAHRWFDDDVPRHLARLARSTQRYGLIVLDPPVLGHSAAASTFALDRDLDGMLENALAALVLDGLLVVSIHARAWSQVRLLGAIQAAATRVGRGVELVTQMGLPPWDHPEPRSFVRPHPDERGNYLTTLVLKAG